jgi:hypothetical protein
MSIDEWTRLDLHAFIITMFVCGLLGFFEVTFGTTAIIGLALYCGLRYLQGMR